MRTMTHHMNPNDLGFGASISALSGMILSIINWQNVLQSVVVTIFCTITGIIIQGIWILIKRSKRYNSLKRKIVKRWK